MMMTNFARVNAYDPLAPDLSHICNTRGGTTTVNPTCNYGGGIYYTCSECGKISGTKQSLDALGHSYSDATCTKAATCSRCSATSGSALGHDPGDWKVTSEPNCVDKGLKKKFCQRSRVWSCDRPRSTCYKSNNAS